MQPPGNPTNTLNNDDDTMNNDEGTNDDRAIEELREENIHEASMDLAGASIDGESPPIRARASTKHSPETFEVKREPLDFKDLNTITGSILTFTLAQ